MFHLSQPQKIENRGGCSSHFSMTEGDVKAKPVKTQEGQGPVSLTFHRF